VNQETILKIAFWAFPICFAAGTFAAQISGSGADVVQVEKDLAEHEALEGHPVGESRLDVLVEEQRELLHEQRAMRGEMQDQALNVAAICQATPGARCK